MSRHLRSTRRLWWWGAGLATVGIAGGAYLWAPTSATVDAPLPQESSESPSESLSPSPSTPDPTPTPTGRETVTEKATERTTATVTAPPKTTTAPAPTITRPGPTHTVTVTPKPTTVKPNPTYGSGMSQYEVDVLTLVWKERASVCPKQIVSDPVLNKYARDWSAHMSATGSMVHSKLTFPGASRAENIAAGYNTPEKVMAAWMNSPGHRENLMNCAYTKIGIGFVASGNYWTQVFAS